MEWWRCVVLLYVMAVLADDEWREVKTAQGPVRGRKQPSEDLYILFNIPYATAPVGVEKFKPPLPPPVWLESYDAVDKEVITKTIVSKSRNWENAKKYCLIANVYVQNTKEKILPVLKSCTKDVPGNAGMKDQVAQLRWVQKNITSFGGNPEDVTNAGYSSGSASVDLLMLSKSAEVLFHQVISESGANLALFSIQKDPLENAKIAD